MLLQKAGKLPVHRRDFTADYRLMVLLDVEDHEQMWEAVNQTQLIEYGIRLLLLSCNMLLNRG